MKIAEIYKKDLERTYKNDIKRLLRDEYYVLIDEKYVKNAFNFGHGTKDDLREYMQYNESCFIYYDLMRGRRINHKNI